MTKTPSPGEQNAWGFLRSDVWVTWGLRAYGRGLIPTQVLYPRFQTSEP